ncbi:similar to Saccharomyces cerevisiae YDR248C Putative protein of unknown function [Maudiozyma saulgeensis]|uniref:Gluconokinase n=1 Tax=Maudiozyma saulgeensis TaxID=1789683 RepID=A0A1X7R5R4_9SACH|nr:similar to Saccharomyces cerevisiae YDR248C Putative protein of unknown function [Kazachstania saulgeensis]
MTTKWDSSKRAKVIVLAGTSGTGKTSVASNLLEHYMKQLPNLKYLEGDDLHPPANVAKMSSGHPLQDEDRWDWLKVVAHRSADVARLSHGISIITCSSLKKKYRDLIRATEPEVDYCFIFLYANQEEIFSRLNNRKGHFMKANMMQSQFNDLELPIPNQEKNCAVVNFEGKPLDVITNEVLEYVEKVLHDQDF